MKQPFDTIEETIKKSRGGLRKLEKWARDAKLAAGTKFVKGITSALQSLKGDIDKINESVGIVEQENKNSSLANLETLMQHIDNKEFSPEDIKLLDSTILTLSKLDLIAQEAIRALEIYKASLDYLTPENKDMGENMEDKNIRKNGNQRKIIENSISRRVIEAVKEIQLKIPAETGKRIKVFKYNDNV